ncbi:hypothetical protein SAMN05421813_11530 [Daejeonella rubra]|uniref:LPXTG-motif cell wall anchor domain-containing protein n=1 Tax=Daejeonella rubra TaxID=990371 RepID=A0A1G9U3B5_9SPHI|nr:hypothetical protein [Daejeonella rubra]SDM54469.1 hypothetical protein SAMN05421813_11530 [Daejeonella rubra]
MRTFKIILVGFILIFSALSSLEVSAQCSMCTLNAENSVQNGNTEGKGLNNGILYLLAAPYLAIAGVGFLWYKKYRRKSVSMNIKDSKINLN